MTVDRDWSLTSAAIGSSNPEKGSTVMKAELVLLIGRFLTGSSPPRRPLCPRPGGRHQEHKVLCVRAVGPPQTPEKPHGVLHRWPRRRIQELVRV